MHDGARKSTGRGSVVLQSARLAMVAFAFWLLIVWPLSPLDGRLLWGDICAGLAVALVAAMVLRERYSEHPVRLANPLRIGFAFAYLAVFTVYVIRGNLDVAYRVLNPALPIRPGIVAAKTRLRTSAARTLLANSITLTPGTLTVDIVGDTFFIHCINVEADQEYDVGQGVMDRFEGLIARMLE